MKPIINKLFNRTYTKIRQAVYRSLGFFDHEVLKQKNKVFILAYHSVYEDNWRFSIDILSIKKQIDYIQKQYKIITLSELKAYVQGENEITQPSVVLTFDDGYKDILRLKGYFAKNRIQPALFVLSDSNKANIQELGTKRPFLNKKDILTLSKAGWEIGCHSATHANFSTINSSQIEQEVVGAKQNLEKELGIKIEYFSYPRGKYTHKVLKSVKKAGFLLGLTMDDGFIIPKVDLLTLPRIGIDRTHSFDEFAVAFSPSVVRTRQFVKNTFLGRFL